MQLRKFSSSSSLNGIDCVFDLLQLFFFLKMLIFNAVLILLVSHVDAGKTSPEALTKFQPASKDPLPKAPYCGLALNDRIAGGDLARIDEFPWVAQILYSLRDSREYLE